MKVLLNIRTLVILFCKLKKQESICILAIFLVTWFSYGWWAPLSVDVRFLTGLFFQFITVISALTQSLQDPIGKGSNTLSLLVRLASLVVKPTQMHCNTIGFVLNMMSFNKYSFQDFRSSYKSLLCWHCPLSSYT